MAGAKVLTVLKGMRFMAGGGGYGGLAGEKKNTPPDHGKCAAIYYFRTTEHLRSREIATDLETKPHLRSLQGTSSSVTASSTAATAPPQP